MYRLYYFAEQLREGMIGIFTALSEKSLLIERVVRIMAYSRGTKSWRKVGGMIDDFQKIIS